MKKNKCRVCLKETTNSCSLKENVGELQIWMIISQISLVAIKSEDQLPQKICQKCFKIIQKIVDFKKLIVQSDEKLRGLNNSTIKCKTESNLNIKVEPDTVFSENWNIIEDFDDTFVKQDDNTEHLKSWEVIERFDGEPEKRSKVQIKDSSKSNHRCCMCPKQFRTIIELSNHCSNLHPNGVELSQTYSKKHIHECLLCHQKFKLKKSLLAHRLDSSFVESDTKHAEYLEARRNNEKKVCSQCGLKLHDRVALEMHEATKHGLQRTFICGFNGCQRAFAHENSVKKHKQTVHADKKFVCDTCGKRYTSRSQMKRHALIHLANKPYQCSQCPRSFVLEHIYQNHILAVHSGIDYPFNCNECNKCYKWQTDLRSHKMVHQGKFPYTCKLCNKGYTSGSSRKYHQDRCTVGQNNIETKF